MVIAAIIILIALGILLILLEFFVIPGFTVAGIGGILMLGAGNYLAYNSYGKIGGNITLGISLFSLLIIIIIAFRSKTWNKLMLNSEISSAVKNYEDDEVVEGDEGVTISRLAPMGKIKLNGKYIEAQSNGEYIPENSEIIVEKILKNKVIVKLKKG